MVGAKKYVYASRFEGFPTDDNIKLVEEDLPLLQDGEVLFTAEYLTVDPYMRILMDASNKPLGSIMMGDQVAIVSDSRNTNYKIGDHYLLNVGWRSHSVVKPGEEGIDIKLIKDCGLPISLALGVLGMPGATAYLGLVELLKPKAGEVVFVNAAAGAVGQVVGQVAKILGCTVIGCAGSPDKVKLLKDFGFDVVFNYKTEDYKKVLSEAAPSGINCFFDNVGGEFGNTVVRAHMAQFGRVVTCGSISTSNDKQPYKDVLPYAAMRMKALTVHGFVVTYHFNQQKWEEAFTQMSAWIKEGKLKYIEHVTNGFQNMRKAFYELFTGENIGKAIIKV